MKDLVTVTCNKHLNQMTLQSESIQMHLAPCTHWVIVNEKNADTKMWRETLSPFYTNHKLNLIFSNDEFEGIGWHTQQSYKFWIYKYINDDYLILDSKNFFIRPSSVEAWIQNFLKQQISLDNKMEGWHSIMKAYAYHIGIDNPMRSMRIHTPFVFEKVVLDSIEDFDEFLKWFSKVHSKGSKSEFIYYSFLADKLKLLDNIKQKDNWSAVLFPNSKGLFDFLSEVSASPSINNISIHPDVINHIISDQELEYFNIWLSSKNFKTIIKKVDIPKN